MSRWTKAPKLASPTFSCELIHLECTRERSLILLFRVEFGEPVLYARDNKKGCYYLGVPRDFLSDGGMLLNAQGAHEAIFLQRPELSVNRVHVPRPPNAYILYRKERHQIVKNKRPDITNNEICK